MKYKLWRLAVLPYDLPWVDRIKISDELLEKILLEGLDAHQDELVLELKKQNLIDHYERFRKAYRTVAFSVGFVHVYHKFGNEYEKQEQELNEAEKKEFMDEFNKLAKAIEEASSATEKTEHDLKEEQFQRILKSFKERYGEEPTEEEKEQIRQKIFGGT